MKRMRKCVVLLLALALVVALGASAYAASDCTITVNNAMPGETYTAYKMLSVSVNEDMTSFAYKLNGDAWDAFFKESGAGADYVTVDANDYVTWKVAEDKAAKFAEAAKTFASGKTVTATAVGVASVTDPVTVTATFTGLEPGYYLITSSGGTKVIVDTTPANPNPTINDKNQAPTLDKQVQEDSNNEWGASNTAQIGDTVNFKVTIAVQPGALNYVMHDKMDDGLTFSGADSVVIKNGNDTLTAGTDYTMTSTGLTDGCTFEIVFDQTYLNSITKNTTLTVTYSAVLNEKAVAGEAKYNKAYLKYGDVTNESSQTPDSKTETNTYKFSVLKYAGSDNEKSPLAGAEFKLQVVDKENKATDIKLIKVDNTTYRVANGDEEGAVDTFTTVANSQITIYGVDLEDTYQLVEVTAPAGYNLLKDPVKVTVNSNNTLVVEVANNAGTELPSTGGTGTTMIYLAGSVLVVAALVLFITKRRMDAGR